jgi:aspartate carbamoyltransferase regulatory subunit
MDNEEKEKKSIARNIIKINIILTVALALIAIVAVKSGINFTKTTKALSEVAQKVGVDFPTTTNNVLGCWEIVKPK